MHLASVLPGLSLWTAEDNPKIRDLQLFMATAYDFWNHRGFWNAVQSKMMDLLNSFFVFLAVFFIAFVVNWELILHCHTETCVAQLPADRQGILLSSPTLANLSLVHGIVALTALVGCGAVVFFEMYWTLQRICLQYEMHRIARGFVRGGYDAGLEWVERLYYYDTTPGSTTTTDLPMGGGGDETVFAAASSTSVFPARSDHRYERENGTYIPVRGAGDYYFDDDGGAANGNHNFHHHSSHPNLYPSYQQQQQQQAVVEVSFLRRLARLCATSSHRIRRRIAKRLPPGQLRSAITPSSSNANHTTTAAAFASAFGRAPSMTQPPLPVGGGGAGSRPPRIGGGNRRRVPQSAPNFPGESSQQQDTDPFRDADFCDDIERDLSAPHIRDISWPDFLRRLCAALQEDRDAIRHRPESFDELRAVQTLMLYDNFFIALHQTRVVGGDTFAPAVDASEEYAMAAETFAAEEREALNILHGDGHGDNHNNGSFPRGAEAGGGGENEDNDEDGEEEDEEAMRVIGLHQHNHCNARAGAAEGVVTSSSAASFIAASTPPATPPPPPLPGDVDGAGASAASSPPPLPKPLLTPSVIARGAWRYCDENVLRYIIMNVLTDFETNSLFSNNNNASFGTGPGTGGGTEATYLGGGEGGSGWRDSILARLLMRFVPRWFQQQNGGGGSTPYDDYDDHHSGGGGSSQQQRRRDGYTALHASASSFGGRKRKGTSDSRGRRGQRNFLRSGDHEPRENDDIYNGASSDESFSATSSDSSSASSSFFNTAPSPSSSVSVSAFRRQHREVKQLLLWILLGSLIIYPCIVAVFVTKLLVKNIVEFRARSQELLSRQWTSEAEWTFRLFNEVPHIAEARLRKGAHVARKMIDAAAIPHAIYRALQRLASTIILGIVLITFINASMITLGVALNQSLFWWLSSALLVYSMFEQPDRDREYDHRDDLQQLTDTLYFEERTELWQKSPMAFSDNMTRTFLPPRIASILFNFGKILALPAILLYLYLDADRGLEQADHYDENLRRVFINNKRQQERAQRRAERKRNKKRSKKTNAKRSRNRRQTGASGVDDEEGGAHCVVSLTGAKKTEADEEMKQSPLANRHYNRSGHSERSSSQGVAPHSPPPPSQVYAHNFHVTSDLVELLLFVRNNAFRLDEVGVCALPSVFQARWGGGSGGESTASTGTGSSGGDEGGDEVEEEESVIAGFFRQLLRKRRNQKGAAADAATAANDGASPMSLVVTHEHIKNLRSFISFVSVYDQWAGTEAGTIPTTAPPPFAGAPLWQRLYNRLGLAATIRAVFAITNNGGGGSGGVCGIGGGAEGGTGGGPSRRPHPPQQEQRPRQENGERAADTDTEKKKKKKKEAQPSSPSSSQRRGTRRAMRKNDFLTSSSGSSSSSGSDRGGDDVAGAAMPSQRAAVAIPVIALGSINNNNNSQRPFGIGSQLFLNTPRSARGVNVAAHPLPHQSQRGAVGGGGVGSRMATPRSAAGGGAAANSVGVGGVASPAAAAAAPSTSIQRQQAGIRGFERALSTMNLSEL